jgi:hypothetical protein
MIEAPRLCQNVTPYFPAYCTLRMILPFQYFFCKETVFLEIGAKNNKKAFPPK